LHDFRRGPVNVAVITLKTLTMRARNFQPIDATSLFWCFVLLTVAAFLWLTGNARSAVYCCIGAFVCVTWQGYSWYLDAKIARDTKEWCGTYYPHNSDVRLYSFVNSISRDAGGRLNGITPETEISGLDWFHQDGLVDDFQTPHKNWMDMIADDAGIPDIDSTRLEGKTLGDVITMVTGSNIA
jgi:hypothetical protein